MTFGYEAELGDVLRSRKVPPEFGTWEYSETDILNLNPPYRFKGADPLGEEPPVGGEINIYPGHTPEEVAQRVVDTIEWFRRQGDDPTAACTSHGHVHVRVRGLRDNIKQLKKLTTWVLRNQDELLRHAHAFKEHPRMGYAPTARTYLKWDGGRPLPEWMGQNILRDAKDFDDFIRIHCCGKDGKSRGRPFRYAINMYCLKHTDTIEFRFFRASLLYKEILGTLQLARDIVIQALEGTGGIGDLLDQNNYVLPPFWYDHDACLAWETNRWGKERGKKERRLIEID